MTDLPDLTDLPKCPACREGRPFWDDELMLTCSRCGFTILDFKSPSQGMGFWRSLAVMEDE